MSVKKKAVKKATKTTKLALTQTTLAELREKIAEYFSAVRYRTADSFQITLQATVTNAEGVKQDGKFNVPSLLASVLTAQGLGKEVKLEAVPNAQGGMLYVRFYSPVPTNGLPI